MPGLPIERTVLLGCVAAALCGGLAGAELNHRAAAPRATPTPNGQAQAIRNVVAETVAPAAEAAEAAAAPAILYVKDDDGQWVTPAAREQARTEAEARTQGDRQAAELGTTTTSAPPPPLLLGRLDP